MANRKGITSLDLLFRKSAQEITWEKKSSLLNLKIVTYILSFAVVEGAEDDQDADHHKYESWQKTANYTQVRIQWKAPKQD